MRKPTEKEILQCVLAILAEHPEMLAHATDIHVSVNPIPIPQEILKVIEEDVIRKTAGWNK